MYLVVSDIHGCLNEFNKLLEHWNPEKEKLVFLGDAVDRGPDSLGVVRKLMQLKADFPEQTIFNKGNHDADFVSWVHTGEKADFYYNPHQEAAIKSFYQGRSMYADTRIERAAYIRDTCKEELAFLKGLPCFNEEENVIFVHAGFNPAAVNWRETPPQDMLWIREEFYLHPESLEKPVYFGHTPVQSIRGNRYDSTIWKSLTAEKYGIDGGCSMGGQLNGVRVGADGKPTEVIQVSLVKKMKMV